MCMVCVYVCVYGVCVCVVCVWCVCVCVVCVCVCVVVTRYENGETKFRAALCDKIFCHNLMKTKQELTNY